MKKKLFCLLLILVMPLCLLFTGCDAKDKDGNTTESRIVQVYEDDDTTIYVDRDTRVMYLFVRGYYKGGLVVMVDQFGEPVLYKGEL